MLIGIASTISTRAGEPARIAGLADRKGRIAPGMDADLVAWDPDGDLTVEAERLHARHKLTPYLGRALKGEFVVTSVTIEKPVVTLIRSADGSMNLPKRKSKASAAPVAAPPIST